MTLVIRSAATGVDTALEWEAAFVTRMQNRITRAAYGALKDTGEDVKRSGRQAIAAGGFGPKWQNAYRVKIYPEQKESSDAALWVYHKIPYAGIFETGGRVTGNPIMWIPTKNVPVLGGRLRKMSPKRFIKEFGPLTSRRRSESNKTPLLFGRLAGSKKVVPMFIGIRMAQHRSRFNVGESFNAAARRFFGYYFARLEQSGDRE